MVQSLQDYEQVVEEREFMRGVVKGLTDLEEGREMSLAEVKARYGQG